MLKRIATHDVEPTDLNVSLCSRLNLLAGDNGLGKTFLLDLAFWVLTGSWARNQAIPKRTGQVDPLIEADLLDQSDSFHVTGRFDFKDQLWTRNDNRVGGLVIYTSPDGGFEVWNTFRASMPFKSPLGRRNLAGDSSRFSFKPDQVWDGLVAADGTVLCNGMIRDWVSWQFQRPQLFDLFSRVLAQLSPYPNEVLKPGPPQRISVDDARDIPTILLPYGQVPVTHASAGMRRILALAYILIWTWHEHTEVARLQNRPPLDELVLLIDEVDAHLHPAWQRVIVPALMQALPLVEPSLRVQILASTHAPLVLASVETIFDAERDGLLHFTLQNGQILVEEIPWAKQGDVTNWLVSEAFGLKQARSPEAERAIEAAEAFMRGAPTPPDLDSHDKIQTELLRVLPGHDDFWPRWLVETGVVK